MKVLKSAGIVVLTLVLALTWTWADLLKERNYIDSKERIWILIVLTALLAMQQIYLVLPKPADRAILEARRTVTESFLQGFRNKYYTQIVHLGVDTNALPTVRTNIMLPTKKMKGLFGTYLKIYYFACPTGIVYADNEFSLKWKKENGTCGWAWIHGESSIYDSQTPELKLSSQRLNQQQVGVVNNIKSALSVPIWYNGNVVGVLSMDSKQNVNETLFTHEDIYTLALACANSVGAQCFEDGVQA